MKICVSEVMQSRQRRKTTEIRKTNLLYVLYYNCPMTYHVAPSTAKI